MQATVNSLRGIRWPVLPDRVLPADEEVHLWVELHNHVEIQAVYGREAATQALQRMHQRMIQWGARTQAVRETSALVRFRARTLTALCDSQVFEHEGDGVARGLEALQVRLAGDALDVCGQRVLPWVVIHEAEAPGGIASEPRHRHRPSGSRIVATALVRLATRGRPDDWRARYRKDMALAWQWQAALEQGQASLVLQPVRHARTCQDLYHEALLRIHADHVACDGSSRSAGDMIAALERLGLVRSLDRSVVSTVLDRLEADSARRLGCNISAASLRLDRWWGTLLRRLQARPDVATRLTLEVTETMPVTDRDAASVFLGRLKALGCRIALDDVGSGHSNLDLAREIRPDVIKVDAALLHAARSTRQAARVLEKLADCCRTLASHVVIEGVEQAQDLALAQQAGLEWLQGYAIAMPSAAAPAMPVLAATSSEISRG